MPRKGISFILLCIFALVIYIVNEEDTRALIINHKWNVISSDYFCSDKYGQGYVYRT